MTHEWDAWGVRVPLTVLWIDDCQVQFLALLGNAVGPSLVLSSFPGHPLQKGMEDMELSYAGSRRTPARDM